MAPNAVYLDPLDGYYGASFGNVRYSTFQGSFVSSGGYQNRPYLIGTGGGGSFAKFVTPVTQTFTAGFRWKPATILQRFIMEGRNISDQSVILAGVNNTGVPYLQVGGGFGPVNGTTGFTFLPATWYYVVIQSQTS